MILIHVSVRATVTKKELVQQLLQHLRDFDAAHKDEVLMQIQLDGQGISAEEMEEMFKSVSPHFDFVLQATTEEARKKGKKAGRN